MADIDLPSTEFAPSAQRKPPMSITLPRNFRPLCLDGSEDPKTPDQTFAELKLPPAPHHSTLRINRPRINMENFQARNNALPATLFASEIPIPSSASAIHTDFGLSSAIFSPDLPLPSIETPSSTTRPAFHHSITDPSPSDRLRLPTYREQPPRTPPAQTKITPTDLKPSIWDMQRSTSECSIRSDSSLSSSGTFTTRPTSFNGSATSPDLESFDPFSPHKVNIIPDTPSRKSKKLRLNTALSKDRVKWSIEMDNHLFNVYQMYLADPSVTPFKTVPGSIPPTGVCHRVARRARETWPKASRISRPIVGKYKLWSALEDRIVARDRTPEPNDFLRTDSASSLHDARGTWPSESSTRKRLKQLCREKFTISAHYQRLRESRSPSPFAEQFPKRPSSRRSRSASRQLKDSDPSTLFATRELGISLVASGATAPLAQLVTGDSPPTQQSDDWFNTPIASSVESKTKITPAGLGIETDRNKLSVAGSIPRLASPFTYSTWNGPSRSNHQHRRHISQNQFDTVHATGLRLLSPFKLEPDVSLNVNKRRAQHNLEDELSPSGSHINLNTTNLNLDMQTDGTNEQKQEDTQELVFTGVGDISQRRIRLRNRGATLGGTVSSREHIERIFTPPIIQAPMNDVPQVPVIPPSLAGLSSGANSASTGLAPPEVDPSQKRLGSPFELDHTKRSNRAKAPRHIPSLSDPFILTSLANTTHSQSNVLSIGERLSVFHNLHQHQIADQRARNDDPFA